MSRKNAQRVTGLFAFWRYDQYPFVLGAPVTEMDDEGKVYVPNYQGWVKPLKLMPLKKGKELLEALKGAEGLERQRKAALEKFEDHWARTLHVLFPEALNPDWASHQRVLNPKKGG